MNLTGIILRAHETEIGPLYDRLKTSTVQENSC